MPRFLPLSILCSWNRNNSNQYVYQKAEGPPFYTLILLPRNRYRIHNLIIYILISQKSGD